MRTKNLRDLVLFRGKKKSFIHTRNITLDDVRAVFFPTNFHEKYAYLGAIPFNEGSKLFDAMEPLVVYMDHKAKPRWCPRWVLRFLHLFGSDNSVVRVRNVFLHQVLKKITKGFLIVDYKTKWEWYDLRISIYGTRQMYDLADGIEAHYYDRGSREDLADKIKQLDPTSKFHAGYTREQLNEELSRLTEQTSQ